MSYKQSKSIQEQIIEQEENDAWDQIILSQSQYMKHKKESTWLKRNVNTLGYQKKTSLYFKAKSQRTKSEKIEITQSLLDETREQAQSQQESDTLKNKQSTKGKTQENYASLKEEELDPEYIKDENNSRSQICKASHMKSHVKEKYFEYQYRWVNTAVFFFAAIVQALSVHTFTPIGTYLQDIYGKSSTMITMPALMYMLISPLTMPVVNWLVDRFDIQIGSYMGGALLILGTGIKCLTNLEYSASIMGAALCGIGSSFISNCPTKVASNWYKPANRGLISMLLTLAIMTSPIWGTMIPPMFVKKESEEDDVFILLVFEFGLTSLSMILIFIFFKKAPPTPPSFSAEMKREPFLPQIKMLFKNKDYYLLIGAVGSLVGGLASFITVLSFYLTPYGYTASEISLFVVMICIFGVISSGLVGIYVKKTRRLKFTILCCITFVAICFGLFQILLMNVDHSVPLMCFIFGFVGAGAYPAISAMVELGAEIAFPVGEASITGFIFAAQQLIGFLMGLVASTIVDGKGTEQEKKDKVFKGFILFQAMYVVAILCMAFLYEDFKRTRGECKGSIKIQGNILDLDEEEIDHLREQLKSEKIL